MSLGAIDRPQNLGLGRPRRQATFVQSDVQGSDKGQQQTDNRGQLLDLSLQPQYLHLQSDLVYVEEMTRDHALILTAKPANRSRAGNPKCGNDIGVAAGPHEISQPVVVGFLGSSE